MLGLGASLNERKTKVTKHEQIANAVCGQTIAVIHDIIESNDGICDVEATLIGVADAITHIIYESGNADGVKGYAKIVSDRIRGHIAFMLEKPEHRPAVQ